MLQIQPSVFLPTGKRVRVLEGMPDIFQRIKRQDPVLENYYGKAVALAKIKVLLIKLKKTSSKKANLCLFKTIRQHCGRKE